MIFRNSPRSQIEFPQAFWICERRRCGASFPFEVEKKISLVKQSEFNIFREVELLAFEAGREATLILIYLSPSLRLETWLDYN